MISLTFYREYYFKHKAEVVLFFSSKLLSPISMCLRDRNSALPYIATWLQLTNHDDRTLHNP